MYQNFCTAYCIGPKHKNLSKTYRGSFHRPRFTLRRNAVLEADAWFFHAVLTNNLHASIEPVGTVSNK